MKAIVHHGDGWNGLKLMEMDEPAPKEGQVKVRLKTAGLNHRDIWTLFRHKADAPPVILGSDGAGVVEAVGPGVDQVKIGEEVIINPGLGWEKKSPAPPPGYQILGFPEHGTFAPYVVVPAANVAPKPAYLSWEEAGALALAALTAYRATFTRANIKPNQTLFLPGIGSGVATFILQMAKAVGARVVVTSRYEDKRKKAIDLGADLALDSEEDWLLALKGEQVDVVIESVGQATFNKSLSVLKPGGTMVTFGATTGDITQLDLRAFFYGQYNLLGSTMGSGEEFQEMLAFVEKHRIRPVIDRQYPLADYEEAFQRLDHGEQFGKIVFALD